MDGSPAAGESHIRAPGINPLRHEYRYPLHKMLHNG